MPNPIRYDEIFNVKELDKLIAKLEETDRVTNELRKNEVENAKKLSKELEQLGEQYKDNTDEIEKNAQLAKKIEKEYNKLTDAINENAIQLEKAKQIQSKLRKVNRLEAQELAAKKGSFDQLTASLKLNELKYKQLTEEQRKNTKQGKQLAKTISEQRESLREINKEMGKGKGLTVNLADSFKQLFQGVDLVDGAMDLLSKTPLLLLFTTLTTIINVLTKSFFKSKEGVAAMDKVLGAVDAVMSILVKTVTGLKDELIELFTDPVGKIKEFGKELATSIIDRFKATLSLVGNVGKGLLKLLTGNFAEAKQLAKDALTDIGTVITGLDKQEQEKLANTINKTAEAFANLRSQKRQLELTNAKLSAQVEKLNVVQSINENLASDTTLSYEKQREALNNAAKAAEEKAKIEAQIARNGLKILDAEIKVRRNNNEEITDLLTQRQQSLNEIASAEGDLTIVIAENERERRQIRSDELERDLDILLDGFDNQLKINERRLKNSKLTAEQRVKIFEETKQIRQKALDAEVAAIQETTDKQIDINDLLATSDATRLREKIRGLGLSEKFEGRLLETIRDNKDVTQDLIELEKELGELRNKEFTVVSTLDNSDQFDADLIDLEAVKEQGEKVSKAGSRIKRSFIEKLKGGSSIIDALFGEGFGGRVKEQISKVLDLFSVFKDQFNELNALRKQIADENLQTANKEVDTLKSQLNEEIKAREAGLANRETQVRKELEIAKKAQKEAENERKRVQRNQLLADSITQASNLVTASTKIAKDFGYPLAIPFIAAMFGGFVVAKAKALKLTKKTNRKGDFAMLTKGTRHEHGNDIPLGYNTDGKPTFAERGEAIATFNSKAVSLYGASYLSDLTKAINGGTLFDDNDKMYHNNVNVNIPENNNEKYLKDIANRDQVNNQNGKTVVRNKNVTTIYV